MDLRIRVLLVWATGPAISFFASHLVALVYRHRFSSIPLEGEVGLGVVSCIPFIAPGVFFAKIRDLGDPKINSLNYVRGFFSYIPAVVCTAVLWLWSNYVEVNTIPGQGAPMSGVLVIMAFFPLALVSWMIGLASGWLYSKKK